MNPLFEFEAIGVVHSPYREKFGIPRQPGLVREVVSVIEMYSPFDDPDAFIGMESFSHLWLSFVFHGVTHSTWRPMVRPPRLGGNDKVGVFATRSTHRPNPIGLSVVELLEIRNEDNRVCLDVAGGDLMDGTPILDIKPYLPYADSIPEAKAGFATERPGMLRVDFDPVAEQQLAGRTDRSMIEGVLAQDPRPAYHGDKERVYGVRLADYDVRFIVEGDTIRVLEIKYQDNDE